MSTSAVSLLDEAIVPFQLPATLAVVPLDSELGATELPPHAAAPTIRQTMSATRMAPSPIRSSWLQVFALIAAPRMFAHARAGLDRSGRRPLTALARRQSRNRCAAPRSEERRVGKERRAGWGSDQ